MKQMHQQKKTRTRSRNTKKSSKSTNSLKKKDSPQSDCNTGHQPTRSDLKNIKSIKYQESSDKLILIEYFIDFNFNNINCQFFLNKIFIFNYLICKLLVFAQY